jgi:hypothetical protein
MNPTVEAAWIAGSSGLIGVLVGVTGTVTVARLGFRSTRAATEAANATALASLWAQIEADRRNRIWEKQAASYTDVMVMIGHRRTVYSGMMRAMLTGTKPEEPPAPIDWAVLESRCVAYASPGVLAALQASVRAGGDFQTAISMWAAAGEQAKLMAQRGAPSPGTARERDAARKALDEAHRLDDVAVDLIRAELHAGTDRPPAPPVPQARSAADHSE